MGWGMNGAAAATALGTRSDAEALVPGEVAAKDASEQFRLPAELTRTRSVALERRPEAIDRPGGFGGFLPLRHAARGDDSLGPPARMTP